MKKRKICCLFLILSLMLCGCGKKTSRDHSDETASDPEDISETNDPLEGDITRPVIPLTAESLDGTWVDDEGFVCRFDIEKNTFTDTYGGIYDLISIDDTEITIGQTEMVGSMGLILPVGGTMTIDAVMSGDTLSILDSDAVRSDSQEGREISDGLRRMLAGQTVNTQGLFSSITFNDDMTLMTGSREPEDELSITYDSAVITTEIGDEIYVRSIDDEVLFVYYGSLYLMTGNHVDMGGRWVTYNMTTGRVRMMDFTGDRGEYFAEDPVTGERSELDYDEPRFVSGVFDTTLEVCGVDFVGGYGGPGVYVCYDSLYSSFDEDREMPEYIFVIDMSSPFASAILQRQITINEDRGDRSERIIPILDGFISVDLYDNEWPSEIVHVIRTDGQDVTSQSYGCEMDLMSGCYEITLDGTYEGDISVSFRCPEDITEITSICYEENSYPYDLVRIDTVFEDGYARADISESGTYFLGDVSIGEEVTADNFFTTDPVSTRWAMSEGTDDVIDRVDLDYIRESMNGVFVVDSVEDLASLTYFINVYPRTYEDYMLVWVDQIADIDLTGLDWVSMGAYSAHDGGERSFCGIYCGNGHTIRGLHIENESLRNGFFGNIYASTVIGVNIEDAYITGALSGLICGDTSTTDYIDCHVSGMLPDSICTDSDLFPNMSDFGNNGYNFCSYSISNSEGQLFESGLAANYPHPGSENDLENHFDPDHNGTFDYSEDYFFGGRVGDTPADVGDIDPELDTDGDGIPDYIEITGIHSITGEVFFTDPYDPDTDHDGLTDGEECGFV